MKQFLILVAILNSFLYSKDTNAQENPEVVRERIYVHTDRDNYLVGETIWLKVYAKSFERSWNQKFDKSDSPSLFSKIAYVEVLDSDNKAIIQRNLKLENGTGTGSLYIPFSVSSGGYRIRCYTRWMRNNPPELYFEKFVSIINPLVPVNEKIVDRNSAVNQPMDSVELNTNQSSYPELIQSRNLRVSLEKELFSPREKVSVNLEDLTSDKLSADLSISVHRIDSLDKFSNSGIVNYFENIENVINEKEKLFKPEYEGQLITGVVVACEDESVAGISIYLYNRGKNTIIYTSRTDEEGRFLFVTSEFVPNPSIQLDPEKLDDCFKITMDQPYSTEYSSQEIPAFSISESDLNQISKRSVYMQVNNTSRDEFTQLDTLDYVNFFESGYTEYRLDDYTRFKSLETTFVEYIPEVAVNKRKDGTSFKVRRRTGSMNRTGPLILIDGVVVADHNFLSKVDPYKIERIRIGQELYLVGEITFYGVIGIFTKPGMGLRIQNPNEYHLSRNQGSIAPLFPEYATENDKKSPKPDFRTLLYWNSTLDLKKTKEVEFYTSDVPGTYRGVIQGMSSSGELFSESFTFSVK